MKIDIRGSARKVLSAPFSYLCVAALVAGSTMFGTTPKALSFPSTEGAVLVDSYKSSPIFLQSSTLQATTALGLVGRFLGLPRSVSPSAISSSAISGGTLLLAQGRAGAIGNANFLDESGLVASTKNLVLGTPKTFLAQSFPTKDGAWVATVSPNGLVVTQFKNTRDTIRAIESGDSVDISKLQSRPMESQPRLQLSKTGDATKEVLSLVPGQIVTSSSDLWALEADGTLMRDNGSEAVNIANISSEAVLNASPSEACVVAASNGKLEVFGESQERSKGVALSSYAVKSKGIPLPITSSSSSISFLYMAKDSAALVSIALTSNCTASAPEEISVEGLNSSSRVTQAWHWNHLVVAAFSNPRNSFAVFDASTGVRVQVSSSNRTALVDSPIGQRFRMQFGGYASGFFLSDPASPSIAVVVSDRNVLQVRWISRNDVSVIDAQATTTSTSRPSEPKVKPVGSSTSLVFDPKCAKVEPTQKLLGLAATSVMASSVTVAFSQPSSETCSSSAFTAFVSTDGATTQQVECSGAQRVSDGSTQCVVTGLSASRTYRISVAALWGPNNDVAAATQSDPILVTTINIDLHLPTNVEAQFDAQTETWNLTWAGVRDEANIWRLDINVCPNGMITPVGVMPLVTSRSFGQGAINLTQNPGLFGQNLQFAVAAGIVSTGTKPNFAPATNWTPCAWTPPSRSCFTTKDGSKWNYPIKLSGSLPDSSTNSQATVNVAASVPAQCHLGQSELVYQYRIEPSPQTEFKDCLSGAGWQPDYRNEAKTYSQSCLVGASRSAITSGQKRVLMRYQIVLPFGVSFSDQSDGQQVGNSSVTGFSWPAPGSVQAEFSFVPGSAKSSNSLPDLKIALRNLLLPNQITPDFSVPNVPVIMCSGATGVGSVTQLGSVTYSVSTPANRIPVVTISDNGGANYDLIQVTGGVCSITLVMAVGGGTDQQTVLSAVPITPDGSRYVANPDFRSLPSREWFALCISGNVLTLSVNPDGDCATAAASVSPGAIVAPEDITVTYDGETYYARIKDEAFYSGSGSPPLQYEFVLDAVPASRVTLSFQWTYLNTTSQVTVVTS